MKASEYIDLKEEKPFWGVFGGEHEILIKRSGLIFSMGWDVPINVDAVDFLSYVLPHGYNLAKTAKNDVVDCDFAAKLNDILTERLTNGR